MVSCLFAAILCGGARPAAADPTPEDAALATTLFQDGRALMAAGRLAEACPKLEESQRLDPGGGTLLNLALCHEQAGRLARSWSEFNDAAAVARRDGRRDRELAADSHAAALWPRLSKLTVSVPPASIVEGLRVGLGRARDDSSRLVDGDPRRWRRARRTGQRARAGDPSRRPSSSPTRPTHRLSRFRPWRQLSRRRPRQWSRTRRRAPHRGIWGGSSAGPSVALGWCSWGSPPTSGGGPSTCTARTAAGPSMTLDGRRTSRPPSPSRGG